MAATVVRLVYSRATGRLRSIVIPDNDGQPVSHHPGEDVLVVTLSTYQAFVGPTGAQAYVTQQTGLAPVNDRAVMVDGQGFVIGHHFVDSACGDAAFPGHTLVPHAKAHRGWVQISGRFVGLSEFPEKARKDFIKNRRHNRVPPLAP